MSRQARLREGYAAWYPTIPTGKWDLAQAVRRILLRQLRHGSPCWQPGPRILSDEHFEFRGATVQEPQRLTGAERRKAFHVPTHSASRFTQP